MLFLNSPLPFGGFLRPLSDRRPEINNLTRLVVESDPDPFNLPTSLATPGPIRMTAPSAAKIALTYSPKAPGPALPLENGFEQSLLWNKVGQLENIYSIQ